MTIFRSVMRVGALAALVGALLAGQAEAVPIVSIDPANQAVDVGDAVAFNVNVSGMGAGETIGFFDLMLTFNPAVLGFVSYVGDPGGKMSTSATVIPPAGVSGNTFQLAIDAGFDLSAGDLSTLQVPGFTLATLNFTALASGNGSLEITRADLVDYDFTTLTDASGFQGQVQVGQQGTVPEPATWLLFGTGAALVTVRRRFNR